MSGKPLRRYGFDEHGCMHKSRMKVDLDVICDESSGGEPGPSLGIVAMIVSNNNTSGCGVLYGFQEICTQSLEISDQFHVLNTNNFAWTYLGSLDDDEVVHARPPCLHSASQA